jgi:hypothetical protein
VPVPDRIELNIFSWNSLLHKANLSSLLQAFESYSDLVPTHYSSDDSESPKAAYYPYSCQKFLDVVSNFDEFEEFPILYRKEGLQYEAQLSNNGSKLNSVSVMLNAGLKMKDLPQIFDWSDSISSSLEAEFACVDPFWDDVDYEYMHSAGIRAKDFQANGLVSISARNWFGPHLVKLIGRERINKCGGHIRETDRGGVILDLVEDPWKADAEKLSIAQKEIRKNLEESEVFGDYSKVLRFKPGNKWAPIPQPIKKTSP